MNRRDWSLEFSIWSSFLVWEGIFQYFLYECFVQRNGSQVNNTQCKNIKILLGNLQNHNNDLENIFPSEHCNVFVFSEYIYTGAKGMSPFLMTKQLGKQRATWEPNELNSRRRVTSSYCIMMKIETSFEYLHYYHLQCNVHIRCCNLLVQTRFSPAVSKWGVYTVYIST